MKVTIHSQPRIGWHGPFAKKLISGLHRVGIETRVTDERQRQDDSLAILLGTTLWRSVEASGQYLLVDRCSFGDTNQFVSLVFNGHGRRGNHRVPANFDSSRWEKHGVELRPWQTGTKRVVCGQMESYCRDLSLEDFYYVAHDYDGATHFRPHPTQGQQSYNDLPIWRSFDDVELLMTLNSSVAVQGFIEGIKTHVKDEGGMAYGTECNDESRLALMHWLAWTQWHHDEISEGLPWATLLS